jgi:hypothetical protein
MKNQINLFCKAVTKELSQDRIVKIATYRLSIDIGKVEDGK